jgi:hypothetical protein
MKMRYRLMIFLLCFAGLCAFFAVSETYLAVHSSSEAEQISLRELIARGPGGNRNVILTDFSIVDEYAVVEKKRFSGKWTKVWVPLIPADTPAGAEPIELHAVIFSDKVENARQFQERFDRPQLHGLIDPQSAEPGLTATIMWKSKFPRLDLEKCIVIVEGKSPASALKLALLWMGSLLFLGMASSVWYLARKLDQADIVQAEVVD